MYAVLEITSGSSRGKQLEIRAGQTLKVGRQDQATLVIREDAMMSNVHFTLTCDGQTCRLQDSKSRFGTLLNQEHVSQAIVQDGDRIVAGSTTFVVRLIAEATPATARPPEIVSPVAVPTAARAANGKVKERAPEVGTLHDRVLRVLRQQPQPLYALVDAARDPQVLALLTNSREESQTLYEGPEGEAMADFGPFLVRLPKESAFLETLVREGWGKSWGVYLTCDKPFTEVRKHFRHLLLVKNPDDKTVYFRFYDPRVLRVFLPVCNAEETKQVFGPVRSFLLEAKTPSLLLNFGATPKGAKESAMELVASHDGAGQSLALT
jgi:pSer/pThr/pTyr-binding forkhead associated (FHA) protein